MHLTVTIALSCVALFGVAAWFNVIRNPLDSARTTLAEGAAAIRALLEHTPLDQVDVDMVADAVDHLSIIVEDGVAYDVYTLGYANDGNRIELVASDGKANRVSVTIGPDGTTSPITVDRHGNAELGGFVCRTAIATR